MTTKTRKSPVNGSYVQINIRNQNILKDLCECLPPQEIAAKYDVNAHTVKHIKNRYKDIVKKAKADKEMADLVQRYKQRSTTATPPPPPHSPPAKYSKEWTELQWKKAYEEGRLC